MRNFSLAILALIVPCARATLVGPVNGTFNHRLLENDQIPNQICQVIIDGPEGPGACSGVVISPNEVLTALHCLYSPYVHPKDRPAPSIGVACLGIKGPNVQRAQSFRPVHYSKESLPSNGHSIPTALDLAIVQVAERFQEDNITPARVALEDASGVEDFRHKECALFGYGQRDGMSPGLLRGEKVSFFPEKALENLRPLIRPGQHEGAMALSPSGMFRGDSGGPVMCRHSADSPWELLGVASSFFIILDINSPDRRRMHYSEIIDVLREEESRARDEGNQATVHLVEFFEDFQCLGHEGQLMEKCSLWPVEAPWGPYPMPGRSYSLLGPGFVALFYQEDLGPLNSDKNSLDVEGPITATQVP